MTRRSLRSPCGVASELFSSKKGICTSQNAVVTRTLAFILNNLREEAVRLTAIFTWVNHRYFVGRLALPSRYVTVWLMQLQTAVRLFLKRSAAKIVAVRIDAPPLMGNCYRILP